MKQTAVEWLINELPTIDWSDPWYRDKLSQAKAMEKEQMIDSYSYGIGETHQWETIDKMFEQYYNETYRDKLSP